MTETNEYTRVEDVLLLNDEERKAFITKERWINYPSAQEVINKLDYLRKYEKGKTRVTSILLVGSPFNGKTSILEKYVEDNPLYDLYKSNPDRDTQKHYDKHHIFGIPALFVNAPNESSESRLFSQILNAVNAAYKDRDSVSRKQYLVEYYMKELNVEMIILDEIHGILNGSPTRQRTVMTAIKNLSNSLKIPIVLAGTKDALRAISVDKQTKDRFRPHYLNKWKLNKEFVNLIATFMSQMPLKKESDILNDKAVREILNQSGGYIGDIIGLLTASCIYAIDTKSERITLKELKECKYKSMSVVEKEENLQEL